MKERWIWLLGVLLGCTLLAPAQDLAWKTLWKTGESAALVGDWPVAAEVWRQALTYGDWPFPAAREAVALREIDAWVRVPDRTKAQTALATFLAQHPNDPWTEQARQRETWLVCLTTPEATTQRLSALLADPTRSGTVLIAHLQAVITLLGTPAPIREAFPAALGGTGIRQWLVRSTLAEAALDPEGACATWESLTPTEAADPDAPALVARVTRLLLMTGQAPRAQAMLAGLPPTLAQHATLQPVVAEVAKALPLQGALRAELPTLVPVACESGTRTETELAAWLDAQAARAPGGLLLLDDAVQAYLAPRPLHLQRELLERLLLQRLLAAGFPARVAPRVRVLWDAVAGTAAEPTVARLWGATLRAQGKFADAAAQLVTTCAYQPTPPETLVLALAVCQQADAPELARPLLRRLLTHPPVTESAMQTGYWACLRALAVADLPRAQDWAALLTTAAPEHPLAVKARKRVREAEQEMPEG